MNFDFSVGIGIDLVLCGGQKCLGFSVWIEIISVFVPERNRLEIGVGIKIDLISVMR